MLGKVNLIFLCQLAYIFVHYFCLLATLQQGLNKKTAAIIMNAASQFLVALYVQFTVRVDLQNSAPWARILVSYKPRFP